MGPHDLVRDSRTLLWVRNQTRNRNLGKLNREPFAIVWVVSFASTSAPYVNGAYELCLKWKYRWAPLYPNMDNPNSCFIQSPVCTMLLYLKLW